MKKLRSLALQILILAAGIIAAPVFGQTASTALLVSQELVTSSLELKNEVTTRLHLSPDQKARLEAIQTEYKSRVLEILELLGEKRGEMKKELEAAPFDQSHVMETHRDMKALMSNLLDLRLEELLKTREVLTPDQHKTLLELSAR